MFTTGGTVPDLQKTTDPRIADLTQAGKVRVALYPPQYAKDETGELRGWTIELGRALAERIGVQFVPVEYPAPPKAMEALKTGLCDVGFGAMEGSRTSEIEFFTRSSSIRFHLSCAVWLRHSVRLGRGPSRCSNRSRTQPRFHSLSYPVMQKSLVCDCRDA